MATTEKQIQIAAKLYEMRQFCRQRFGERYSYNVGCAQVMLRGEMKLGNLSPIRAAMKLMKDGYSPITTALFSAALVDEIEGVDNTTATAASE